MSEGTLEGQPEAAKKGSGASFLKLVGILIILAAIAVAGYFLYNQFGGSVAVVNGQKISRAVYNERYAMLSASIASQGISATTTEAVSAIKKQTLENLVTETVILQAANKEGIKANATEVSALFDQNKSQFSDAAAFEKELTKQGYTEATFKAALERENIIRHYFEAHLDLTSAKASDAEVKALYDQAIANDKNIPPLDQVRTQVENQIIQQKQQQLVGDYVTRLKASSTIDILTK